MLYFRLICKKQLFTVLFFSLFFIVEALAQPQSQYGCHLLHYAQQQREMSATEKAEVLAGIERSDSFNILNYEITVDVTRFSFRLLKANTIITFTPKLSGQNKIRFDLERLTVDSILFEPFNIVWEHDGRYIDITFAQALIETEEYELQVFYHGTPIICNEGFGGFYFEGDIAYNLGIGIDCIPHNYGRAWFPCFDNFVEHSTYKYNIISDKGRIGYGVGELIEEEVISSDTIKRVYVMRQPIPSYLSHVAIGPYTEVNYMAKSGYQDIPVQLVVKPRDSANAKTHFQYLEDALQMAESWYGSYMWDMIGYHMTQRGAMEHPTAIAYPDGILSGTNLQLLTHELTHHWWGNIVTLETDADMWIKEGPAAYSEQQMVEYMEGKEAFQSAVKLNNLNMIRTAHIADDGYLPLSPMPQRITYGVHTYNKGASMFHNLRGYLGDSLFRLGMQYVLEERMYGNVNARSFRDLLMEGTSVDLVDFFDDWILSPGWSDFAVNAYQTESISRGYKISGVIKQSQYHSGHFHQNVPIQLTAYFKDLTTIDTVVYASGEATGFSFMADREPTALIVNNDYSLCLASFTSSVLINKEGNYSVNATGLTFLMNDFNEEDIIIVEHHHTAPSGWENIPDNIEISERHYWKVAMSNPGMNTYGFNYKFSRGDSTSLDYNIARDGIDSLLLLYRKDENAPWVEVAEYDRVSMGRYSGAVIDRNAQPGLYTLGHGRSGVLTSTNTYTQADIAIYPTIIDREFKVEGLNKGKLRLHSLSGVEIGSFKITENITQIELPLILPGMYIANVVDEQNRIIYTQKLIKK